FCLARCESWWRAVDRSDWPGFVSGLPSASASPTVADEQARFRAVGWEVIEGKRRNRKMFELWVPGLAAGRGRSKGSGSSRGSSVWTKMVAGSGHVGDRK